MAKLTGPLFSIDARGKLGKCLVFMGWKGIKTVRQWLKPTNPEDPDQGDIRCIIGGLGRSVGKVKVDMDFDVKLKALDVIPDQQSKQSYLVQYIKDTYLTGKGATMTGAYESALASVAAHSASDSWGSAANALGILAFSLDYDTISPFNKRLGLFLIAKTMIALDPTGIPYSIAIGSWTADNISEFANDFTAVT